MSIELQGISLEEINKIRISLGLKPLADDASPAIDSNRLADGSYPEQRPSDARQDEARITDRITRVRNKQALKTKLTGNSLGVGDEPEDALQWVRRLKQCEQATGSGQQKSGEETQDDSYTEKDLMGLRVSHGFEEMSPEESRILTLKDSFVLDDDEDELQNIEMAEEGERREKLALKMKPKVYIGYDDEEQLAGPGAVRSILAKYDDILCKEEDPVFRIGSGNCGTLSAGEDGRKNYKFHLSVDYPESMITPSNYLWDRDDGVQTLKSRKGQRPSRRVAAEVNSMNSGDNTVVGSGAMPDSVPLFRGLNSNFIDDDELQTALTQSRRKKILKMHKQSLQKIAAKVTAEQRVKGRFSETAISGSTGNETSYGMVLDENTEFIQSIQYNPSAPGRVTSTVADRELQDIPMEVVDLALEEGKDDAMAMVSQVEEVPNDDREIDNNTMQISNDLERRTWDTPGIASTLAMLREQGIITVSTANQVEANQTQLQHDMWLAEQCVMAAQQEMKKKNDSGSRSDKDLATREYENMVCEQDEARRRWDSFKDYKPAIDLTEYDPELGQPMTPKEVWRKLSHQFYGKGSGKMKVEKRLKKIAKEKRLQVMSTGDTPLGMSKTFLQLQEKSGQAHYVLSVGNRSRLPPASEYQNHVLLKKGTVESMESDEVQDSGTALGAQGIANIVKTPSKPTASLSIGHGTI